MRGSTIWNLANASTINLFWSEAITSSGGASKFNILLSKNTTFWINGILKFKPGFEIIFFGSPNCKTIAWLTSLTINTEKKIVKPIRINNGNKIFADAFGQDPEFFAFYRAMQAYEKALIGGETSLILSPDSEFFKFFGNINQKPAQ